MRVLNTRVCFQPQREILHKIQITAKGGSVKTRLSRGSLKIWRDVGPQKAYHGVGVSVPNGLVDSALHTLLQHRPTVFIPGKARTGHESAKSSNGGGEEKQSGFCVSLLSERAFP